MMLKVIRLHAERTAITFIALLQCFIAIALLHCFIHVILVNPITLLKLYLDILSSLLL